MDYSLIYWIKETFELFISWLLTLQLANTWTFIFLYASFDFIKSHQPSFDVYCDEHYSQFAIVLWRVHYYTMFNVMKHWRQLEKRTLPMYMFIIMILSFVQNLIRLCNVYCCLTFFLARANSHLSVH